MDTALRLARSIDRLSTGLGRAAGWLLVPMVLVAAWNAVTRYLGQAAQLDLSSNAYLELQWYLFSLVFLFGGAAALRGGDHVRVDVVYQRLSPRARAELDLVGTLLLLLPFAVAVVVLSFPSVRSSWAVWEGSPDPEGLPRYPIKTAVPLAFALLALQALSEAIRRFASLSAEASENA